MNRAHISDRSDALQSRFGLRIGAYLSDGTQQLPHEISERLRAARVRAVAQRGSLHAQSALATSVNGRSAASIAMHPRGSGLMDWLTSFVVLAALFAALNAIDGFQRDSVALELAEVDAALLTDELPPAAYTDPGFAQFLKTEQLSLH